VQAELVDRDEPIEVNFYVLRHPQFGTYIIDSGIESGFREPDSSPRISWLVKTAMKIDTLDVHMTLSEWLAGEEAPLAGVFLTHLHLDHIMGLPDLPKDTPVYAGPGETHATQFMNAFSIGTTDRLLDGLGALQEWPFQPDPAGRSEQPSMEQCTGGRAPGAGHADTGHGAAQGDLR
jgi:N-acyl homoserine lactone hydrolase